MIDEDELVSSLGRDCVVSMRGRVLGGSRNVLPIPGEWTCPGCMRSGCWPTKNTCFRCGTVRPTSPLPPGPVLPNSRPARAPREQRHPGRVPGNSASGCPTERRTPPPQASSAPSPPSVPAAGGLSLDLVVQFLRGLNVPSELLADIQNAVPPPAPKKTAQQITKEQRCSQLGKRWISPSSSWPSCLNGRRLLLRSTLKRLRKWLRSRLSLLIWRWNWKKLVGSLCNLRPLPLRLLRKALVVTPLQESVRWLPLVWQLMLSCFFLLNWRKKVPNVFGLAPASSCCSRHVLRAGS